LMTKKHTISVVIDRVVIEEDNRQRIAEDVEISAIKIGMVPDVKTARIILEYLENTDVPKVLDPVLKSSTGFRIGDLEGYHILMKNVDVVTPNISETQEMSGIEVKDFNSAKKAAIKISDGFSIVITGSGGSDFIYDAKSREFYRIGRRIEAKEVHGTGCVYSTALACFLADGMSLYSACKKARKFVLRAAKRALKIGRCLPVVNP